MFKLMTETFVLCAQVKEFCTKETHNTEAPNIQNRLCGNRGVEEVITSLSVDAGVAVVPTPPSILPTFTVVQCRQRVVCLVLDVSGSMAAVSFDGLIFQIKPYFIKTIQDLTTVTQIPGIIGVCARARVCVFCLTVLMVANIFFL